MNFAIILAAGRSKRMKGTDKLFFRIKKKPLIFYTIQTFEKHPQIKKIVLVGKKNNFQKFIFLIKKYNFKKIAMVTQGGKERQDSALKGIGAAEKIGAKLGDLILFHNAGNPLVSPEEISEVLKAAKKYKAALVGQSAKDTIKEINRNGFLIKMTERKKIFLAQTPQVIEYNLAKRAFQKAYQEKFYGTDDVSLVERLGKKVKIIPCSYKNIKVTTKEDLKIIKVFLKNK